MFVKNLIFIVLLLMLTRFVNNCGTCEDDNGKKPCGNVEALPHLCLFQELHELKNALADLQTRPKVPPRNAEDLPMFDIRYDTVPQECLSQKMPSNCGEATACINRSGYYYIKLTKYLNDSLLVECDTRTKGGDWLVIQRRHDGSEDFYRNWAEYKKGFGDIDREFFIGMENLYALTNFNGPQELMIVMINGTDSVMHIVKYDSFVIGNESEKYVLKGLGRFTGDTRDSLRAHLGYRFVTKDLTDDENENSHCARSFQAAWWYFYCFASNLNGVYGKGVTWHNWVDPNDKTRTDRYGENTMSYVKMMIRRRRI